MAATINQMPEDVVIRRARPEDVDTCGRICFEAFYKINTDHGFPPELPEMGAGIDLISTLFNHSGFWCVVAEQNGRIVGSNCLDERSTVFGIGPITIDPGVQNQGVGRMLMRAMMDRARERKTPSLRLLQAAFHNRSLSLYTKLGFDVQEPISLMNGPTFRSSIPGCSVRRATPTDFDATNDVCQRVHGHSRSGELADAISRGSARVVERQGRITGYASELAFFGHAVGESNLDLQALISGAEAFGGPGILIPTRNSGLFRWCLEKGLRVVEPLTLMTIGLYNQPVGAYLPSILY